MIGRVGRTILKNRKTLLATQTSIRLYSIEDPLSGKSDDFYHYFNLSPADMRKYDRFNYVQPTLVSDANKKLPYMSDKDFIQYRGTIIRNPSLELLTEACGSHINSDKDLICQKNFIDPHQVEIFDTLHSVYVEDIKKYLERAPKLYMEDTTLGSFLYNETHARVISDDPVYAAAFKNMMHRSPLFTMETLPELTVYLVHSSDKHYIIRGLTEDDHAVMMVNGDIDMDTILNSIFRLCNRFFTSKKEVTLPEEESNKTKEQKSSDSAMERLKALEEEEKKDSMEEDSDDKFHLVNHYVLKSDVLRSPDGNTCAIVGMDDAMRMKAYKNKSLFSAYHTLFFNNGVARFWGGIQGPMTEFSPLSPAVSVNQTLFKGVTADPIAGYPSTFLIINDKCKQMTEFNYQELSLLLREKGYHEKGIQFIEKLFRYHKTECFYINPSLCSNAIDCMHTIPLKKIEKI